MGDQSPRELWVNMLQRMRMRMRMREQGRSSRIEGDRLWQEQLEGEAT
jgi:hypothetical protein